MESMKKPAKGQEPSMEEILASIRRIIADDDAAKAQAANVIEPRRRGRTLAAMAPTQPSRRSRRRRASLATLRRSERAATKKDEIDAMVAQLQAPPETGRRHERCSRKFSI